MIANIIPSVKNSELSTCFQCGTCHASCPSGRYTALNIRKIVRDSVRKDVSDVQELWMCTTCYNCQERCPRGIKITDAVLVLRSEAVKKGRILPSHRKVCKFLLETGHAIPLDDVNIEKRRRIGLGSPETVFKYSTALDEVKFLLSSCGFDELIRDKGIK